MSTVQLKNNTGMSLIELLSVLAVVLVMVSVGMPAMLEYRQSRQAQQWTFSMMKVFARARAHAMQYYEEVYICGVNAQGLCNHRFEHIVVFIDKDRSRSFTAGDTVLEQWPVPSKLGAFTVKNQRVAYWSFYPTGRLKGLQASLYYCSDQKDYPTYTHKVVVSLLGRSRVEKKMSAKERKRWCG